MPDMYNMCFIHLTTETDMSLSIRLDQITVIEELGPGQRIGNSLVMTEEGTSYIVMETTEDIFQCISEVAGADAEII